MKPDDKACSAINWIAASFEKRFYEIGHTSNTRTINYSLAELFCKFRKGGIANSYPTIAQIV